MPAAISHHPTQPLRGELRVPGDKSISHRALLCGLLAVGESTIEGLLEGEDVLHTARACEALGAWVKREDDGLWRVRGAGLGSLLQPQYMLDFGNAGTGSRLTMGVVASHPITVGFDGDASLRKRPMGRVVRPLQKCGVQIVSAQENMRLPLVLQGSERALAFTHEIEVPSAQVKSALIFAALNAAGRSTIIEPVPTRDHTERMLKAFGADIIVQKTSTDSGTKIIINGGKHLTPNNIKVPCDPSSAAFPLVAAILVAGSEVVLPNVMLNPLRTGLFEVLKTMGANLLITNQKTLGGEEVGDLVVHSSSLRGIEVPASFAPSMIDEYPILAVAASFAQGTTVMRGLSELRVKESDRLQAVADNLNRMGALARIEGDDLIVEGQDKVRGGVEIKTHLDHRLAMSALVMGLVTQEPVTVDDATTIDTSFPHFMEGMNHLGCNMRVVEHKA